MRLYFDEHMPRAVARELNLRGHEVIMAVDAGNIGQDDDTVHLVFATDQDAVLVTRDRPFAGRTVLRENHAGFICWTGADDDFGGMVTRIAAFADSHTAEDVRGKVWWLR